MWVKLDCNFPDHPKIAGLSASAFRLWVSALAYSNRFATSGTISLPSLPRIMPGKGRATAVQELCNAQLWHVCGDHWVIHDYDDYQLTPEQVEEKRKVKQESGRKGGIASGVSRRSKSEAPASVKTKPDPSRSVPYRTVPIEREAGGSKLLALHEIEAQCFNRCGQLGGSGSAAMARLGDVYQHEMDAALATSGNSYKYLAKVIESYRDEANKGPATPGSPRRPINIDPRVGYHPGSTVFQNGIVNPFPEREKSETKTTDNAANKPKTGAVYGDDDDSF